MGNKAVITERRLRGKGKSRTSTQSIKTILGTLSPEELSGVNAAINAISKKEKEFVEMERELIIMRAGYNSYVYQIQQQYGLPEEYSIDLATGELGPKGEF